MRHYGHSSLRWFDNLDNKSAIKRRQCGIRLVRWICSFYVFIQLPARSIISSTFSCTKSQSNILLRSTWMIHTFARCILLVTMASRTSRGSRADSSFQFYVVRNCAGNHFEKNAVFMSFSLNGSKIRAKQPRRREWNGDRSVAFHFHMSISIRNILQKRNIFLFAKRTFVLRQHFTYKIHCVCVHRTPCTASKMLFVEQTNENAHKTF